MANVNIIGINAARMLIGNDERRRRGIMFLHDETSSGMRRGDLTTAQRYAVARMVAERAGVSGYSLRWSRKAGCKCGCSPGFFMEGITGFDVHADVVDVGSEEHIAYDVRVVMEQRLVDAGTTPGQEVERAVAAWRASPLSTFRRNADDSIACPHRDVSCCGMCEVSNPEIIDVMGAHFWCATRDERNTLVTEIATARGIAAQEGV